MESILKKALAGAETVALGFMFVSLCGAIFVALLIGTNTIYVGGNLEWAPSGVMGYLIAISIVVCIIKFLVAVFVVKESIGFEAISAILTAIGIWLTFSIIAATDINPIFLLISIVGAILIIITKATWFTEGFIAAFAAWVLICVYHLWNYETISWTIASMNAWRIFIFVITTCIWIGVFVSWAVTFIPTEKRTDKLK